VTTPAATAAGGRGRLSSAINTSSSPSRRPRVAPPAPSSIVTFRSFSGCAMTFGAAS